MCSNVAERRVSSPRAVPAVNLLKDEGHVGPKKKKRQLAERAARGPRDDSVLSSGTGARDERLVGRDEKQQRNRTRGEARRLSLTSTMAARKASRQLCTSMGTILVPEAILDGQGQ